MTTKQEIAEIEAKLKLKSALGREYFSNEAQKLKFRFQELRSMEIKEIKIF